MQVRFSFPNSELIFWTSAGIAALVVIGILLRWLDRHRRKRLAQFVDAGLAPRLLAGYHEALRKPLTVVLLLGFAGLALTFAQPHWGETWQEMRSVSRDIMVVLDTSESMRASDLLPSRLERAKQKIAALLDTARGDRFGLIAFAGAAALQCPLTLDHAYFRAVLNAVDTDTISRKGTDIAAALDEAGRVFREERKQSLDYNRNARAVLLISDGEDIPGNAVTAAEKLSEYARIFVIGVGSSEGGVLRRSDWAVSHGRRSELEETHVSVLDEETLMRIATMGNGAYVRSQADSSDVMQMLDLLKSLSARDARSEVRHQLVNRYQWPLAFAIFCFAGEGVWLVLLPWLRRKREHSDEGKVRAGGWLRA